VEEKEDKSPLTEADKAANDIIVAGLEALPQAIPVLTEEAVEAFTGADAQGRYWLVDPLDGTKEFIKRNGEFTVNIALVEQGRPVLGVVYAPALNVTYLGAEGVGAFKAEGKGRRQPIQVAEGAADLYPRLGPTCLWDTGAAHAVVNAAGGAVETPEGAVLSYGNTAETLNPWFVVYGGSRV
jgi:3'(2'), 5'-bisphosphate nucleotidase